MRMPGFRRLSYTPFPVYRNDRPSVFLRVYPGLSPGITRINDSRRCLNPFRVWGVGRSTQKLSRNRQFLS